MIGIQQILMNVIDYDKRRQHNWQSNEWAWDRTLTSKQRNSENVYVLVWSPRGSTLHLGVRKDYFIVGDTSSQAVERAFRLSNVIRWRNAVIWLVAECVLNIWCERREKTKNEGMTATTYNRTEEKSNQPLVEKVNQLIGGHFCSSKVLNLICM